MKLSIYNSYISLGEGISFVYNAFSNKTVIFHREMPDDRSDLLSLPTESTLFTNLVDSGCIVDDFEDELQKLKDAILETDKNASSYTLIVNPTLNCNFKCWYCYESHFSNSMIFIFHSFPNRHSSRRAGLSPGTYYIMRSDSCPPPQSPAKTNCAPAPSRW